MFSLVMAKGSSVKVAVESPLSSPLSPFLLRVLGISMSDCGLRKVSSEFKAFGFLKTFVKMRNL